MEFYKTGDAAKVCGLKDSRAMARLLESDVIPGFYLDSKYQRRRTWRIRVEDLVDYMLKNKIPLDGFSDDIDAQKCIIARQAEDLKKAIGISGRRGVLSRFRNASLALVEIISALDPLDSLDGLSEDRKRATILTKVADFMRRHNRLRGKIAAQKKK